MGDIQILFNSDGVAELYDDTYDLTIHHETAEELEQTKKLLTSARWIPAYSEEKPEDGEEVLCWYEYFRYGNYNRMYQTYGIGVYLQGRFMGDVTSGKNARVLAWRHLPEPPREDEL